MSDPQQHRTLLVSWTKFCVCVLFCGCNVMCVCVLFILIVFCLARAPCYFKSVPHYLLHIIFVKTDFHDVISLLCDFCLFFIV